MVTMAGVEKRMTENSSTAIEAVKNNFRTNRTRS